MIFKETLCNSFPNMMEKTINSLKKLSKSYMAYKETTSQAYDNEKADILNKYSQMKNT